MANLRPMPPVVLPAGELAEIAGHWNASIETLPKSWGEKLGQLCDRAVGVCLAEMLGGIGVLRPKSARALLPPHPDCVEVGPTRVIGGIRPQNFDVVYRPDGVRFAYDSKTLNTRKSLSKNYQEHDQRSGHGSGYGSHALPLRRCSLHCRGSGALPR